MQPFLIEVSPSDEAVTLRVMGELDAYRGDELQRAIDEHCQDGEIDVVIDASDIAFIDTSGLRVLLDVQERVSAHGRSLHLRRPSRSVLQMLDRTGLRAAFVTE